MVCLFPLYAAITVEGNRSMAGRAAVRAGDNVYFICVFMETLEGKHGLNLKNQLTFRAGSYMIISVTTK